jgi:hypothetical protein
MTELLHIGVNLKGCIVEKWVSFLCVLAEHMPVEFEASER